MLIVACVTVSFAGVQRRKLHRNFSLALSLQLDKQSWHVKNAFHQGDWNPVLGVDIIIACINIQRCTLLSRGKLYFKAGFHYRLSRSRSRTISWRQCSDTSDSAYDSVVYDQVKTRLSESQAEAEELNQSQSVGTCVVIGLSFRFCFRLRQVGRKWKGSDSSDSDSVALMTPLTTPIFDFHQVISALTTPLTSPTPTRTLTSSLVKTSL